jgi:putative glycosyltransferase (TIGR04372 family)
MFLIIFHMFWAVPLLVFLRLTKKRLRVALIDSARIGHFVLHIMIAWKLIKNRKINEIYIIGSINNIICNEFWEKLVKRNFLVLKNAKYLQYWNYKLFKEPQVEYILYGQDDSLCNIKDRPKFEDDENAYAKNYLKTIGLSKNDKFVCVIARDSEYLDRYNYIKGRDWKYHNYRDVDISSYVPALDWLTEQGVWVLRMGKIMRNELDSKNPMIIDYAFSRERNDFLDVWLFANCDFCISTGTGPDFISDFYKKPILFLNFIPIAYIWHWSNATFVSKNLVWARHGNALSLKEQLIHNYAETQGYQKRNIIINDLTPEEILMYVKSFWNHLNGKLMYTEKDKMMEELFWKLYTKYGYKGEENEYSKLNNSWINPKARPCSAWLNYKGEEFLSENHMERSI